MLTNKSGAQGSAIILKEKNDFISDEAELVEIFNTHYINIVENTTGKPPETMECNMDQSLDSSAVAKIVDYYSTHPSILKIKEHRPEKAELFSLPLAKKEEINSLIKKIDVTKSAGPDFIPPKLVKLSADIIDEHLTNAINDSIEKNAFPDEAKIAHVVPILKKKLRTEKVNYRPVSVLTTFSKVFEKFIQEKITAHIDKSLSIFISAYRKKYSSNHVLIRLLEKWKESLDNKKFVGAVLMDLSKAFDCVPHDLLIAKLHAYGFDHNSLVFLYSYLKRRKQSVKINNTFSALLILVSGVPQGSILGPILFNIFINDLLLFIENSDIVNFADDNTVSAFSDTIPDLLRILESESNVAIKWFLTNEMIVNPDKFQAIIINKHSRLHESFKLKVGTYEIETQNCVELLGIEIDDKLNFKKHISKLCKKAAGQLNSICRLKRDMNKDAMKVLIESFVYANFNYCPLVWHFCNPQSIRNMEKIQERALRLIYDDNESSYEHILTVANKPNLELRRIRLLAIEIFKTLNNLNPIYLKEIFILNTRNDKNKLYVQSQKSKAYGENSLRSLGPKIWNSLPEHFRQYRSIESFKDLINTWSGPMCKCNICSYLQEV